ncbi:MAG: dimethylargininase, partial [Acidobacteria bacterium]|nr:dimethylargininase [Acidobacteriota bacterium]
ERTNEDGVDQLRCLLVPLGYSVRCLDVQGCLHLKRAVTAIRSGPVPLFLINPEWIDRGVFGQLATIDVDPSEPMAANALEIDGTVLFPAQFERTKKRLTESGLLVRVVPAAELAKAEGGLTCCSVLI